MNPQEYYPCNTCPTLKKLFCVFACEEFNTYVNKQQLREYILIHDGNKQTKTRTT
jgi:hypothetical protein